MAGRDTLDRPPAHEAELQAVMPLGERLWVAVFDLYGFESGDLDAARLALEKALGVRFEGHESLYWGGDYDLYESVDGAVSLRLRYNRDLLWQEGEAPEEQYAEPEFPGMALLLDVRHPEPDRLRQLLQASVPGFRHLRQEPDEPSA